MRYWLIFILFILIGAIDAVPASAAPVKADYRPASTVTAAGDQPHRQFADTPEIMDIVAARSTQVDSHGPALYVLLYHIHQHLLGQVALSLPSRRLKAHVLPFHRLILFPFHGFW